MRITYPGSASDLTLSTGDRFEVAEVRPGLHRTIVRRDFDATASALTFDPGTATEVVFILGGRNRPINSPFIQQQIRAIQVSTQTLRGRA